MSYAIPEASLLALICCVSILPIGLATGLVVWLFTRKNEA